MDRETILKEIKRIAEESGADTVSRSEFKSKSGISEWQIYKHFDSWNEAVEAAGLTPTDVSRIGDAELFREMKNVFVKFGGVCTRMKFDKLCKYSADVYKRRFGKWNDILLAFRTWLKESGEDFPFLNQLPSVTNLHKAAEESIPTEKEETKPMLWDSLRTMTYGPFLNFRGLQHAPVNEQGVVFLFGMVCFELGFVIESQSEPAIQIVKQNEEWIASVVSGSV